VANREYHNMVEDLHHLPMNCVKHPDLQFRQSIDCNYCVIGIILLVKKYTYSIFKTYLLNPTAGIETLESDADRLSDSSSPRGARPSGIDVFTLLL